MHFKPHLPGSPDPNYPDKLATADADDPYLRHIRLRHGRPSISLQSQSYFPFDRLPIEVLQEIFSWCLPPVFTADKADHLYLSLDLQGFNSRTAPLLLCQICRLWRAAALCFPNLWSSINVYVSAGHARPATPLLSRWLARSGGLPLSLGLYQQNEAYENRHATAEVLDLYQRYTHRWQRVRLNLIGEPRYARLLTSQQRSAPMLREFRMPAPSLSSDTVTSLLLPPRAQKDEAFCDIFGIFERVPNLAKLHVSRIPGLDVLLGDGRGWTRTLARSGHGHGISVPWNQLVSLKLDYVPSTTTALRILECCIQLVDCTLKIDATPNYSTREVMVISQLETLSISVYHNRIHHFLSQLTLSALLHLSIHVQGPLDQYDWDQSSFIALLDRSQCHLRSFEVKDSGMRSHQFEECLASEWLQGLERLLVEDRRDWTWEPFVLDEALGLMTCSTFKLVDRGRDGTRAILSGLRDGLADVDVQTTDSEGDNDASRPFCLLPNLHTLTLRGSCLLTSDGALADMVESRHTYYGGQVSRLRRAELEVPSSNAEDVRRFRGFRREGLDVDLLVR